MTDTVNENNKTELDDDLDLDLDLDFNFDEPLDLEEDSSDLDDDLDLDLDEENSLELDDDLDLDDEDISMDLDDDLDLELDEEDDLDLELDDDFEGDNSELGSELLEDNVFNELDDLSEEELQELESIPVSDELDLELNEAIDYFEHIKSTITDEWNKESSFYNVKHCIGEYFNQKNNSSDSIIEELKESITELSDSNKNMFGNEFFADIFLLLDFYEEIVNSNLTLFNCPVPHFENIVDRYNESEVRKMLKDYYKINNNKVGKFKDLFNTLDFDIMRENIQADYLQFSNLKRPTEMFDRNYHNIMRIISNISYTTLKDNLNEKELLNGLFEKLMHLNAEIKNDDYSNLVELIKDSANVKQSAYRDLYYENKEKYLSANKEVRELKDDLYKVKQKHIIFRDLIGEYKDLLDDDFSELRALKFLLKHEFGCVDNVYDDKYKVYSLKVPNQTHSGNLTRILPLILQKAKTFNKMFLLTRKELHSIAGVGDVSVSDFMTFREEFLEYAVKYVLRMRETI